MHNFIIALQSITFVVYSEAEALNTLSLSLTHQYDGGSPAISSDGLKIYYAAYGKVTEYSTSTFIKTREMRVNFWVLHGNDESACG